MTFFSMKTALHLGFPKTATTFLQNQYFSKHPDLHFLGTPFVSEKMCQLLEGDLRTKEDIFLNLDKMKSDVECEIENCFPLQKTGNIKVLSYESYSLTDSFHDTNLSRSEYLRRLKYLFPDSKVILVIRNQLKYPFSYFNTILKGGGTLSYKNFLKWSLTHKDNNYLPQLKYDKYIDLVHEYFPKENIKIICYEEILSNYQEVLNQVSDFLDVQKIEVNWNNDNASMSYLSYILRRYLNKVIRYDCGLERYSLPTRVAGGNGIGWKAYYKHATLKFFEILDKTLKLKAYKPSMDSKTKNELINEFKDSNQRLIDVYHLPVDKYNYPL